MGYNEGTTPRRHKVTRDEVLAILRAHRAELAAFGVKSLALFGSFARDEDRPDSDVDAEWPEP